VSGTVNVGNLPTTQGVSGTVNVGNFPDVQPVSLSIASSSPLPIRDVDNPAHHAKVTYSSCKVAEFSLTSSCSTSFTVPSGSAMVIETVSINVGDQPGEKSTALINFSTDGATGHLYIPLTYIFTSSGVDYYSATLPVRVYADPGTTVTLVGALDGSTAGGTESFQFTTSGYLVSCGSGAGCPLP
jgi:hypothetical protein